MLWTYSNEFGYGATSAGTGDISPAFPFHKLFLHVLHLPGCDFKDLQYATWYMFDQNSSFIPLLLFFSGVPLSAGNYVMNKPLIATGLSCATSESATAPG